MPPAAPVDWERIHGRLDAIGRALTGQVEAAPERARQLLEERARILARPAQPASTGDLVDAVLFELAGEMYALDARFVWEVFRLTALAPLPGAAPPLFAVTAWRGMVLSILDLRRALGLPTTALRDLGHVIVLGGERPVFGVLADAIRELVHFRRKDVRDPPEGVALRREYLQGITGDAILVLAGEELLRRHGPAVRGP
jgi:purine-binding chemotaxis protein CheW